MTPSPKVLKGSEQCQDDYTGENFVRKRAVSQIGRKQWGTKRDLDQFYVNSVLQDQTALGTGLFLHSLMLFLFISRYTKRDLSLLEFQMRRVADLLLALEIS